MAQAGWRNGRTEDGEDNVEPIVGGSAEAARLGRAISGARQAKLWSQPQLVKRMREEAGRLSPGQDLPSDESWKAMLSRWERGHKVPEPRHRILLGRALGLKPAQLGLVESD